MSNEIVVLGYMKRKAQQLTLETGRAHPFRTLPDDELHTIDEAIVDPNEVYGG